MELKHNLKNIITKRGSLNDPLERAKLLRVYAGIFPNNIREFGEKIIPRLRKQKNYSK